MQNGNLILPPFRAEDYNQEVHAQTYRCIAENTFGKIQSRDVHVRAGTADFIFLFGGKLFATGCPFVNSTRILLFPNYFSVDAPKLQKANWSSKHIHKYY